jgi:hypothetical protein
MRYVTVFRSFRSRYVCSRLNDIIKLHWTVPIAVGTFKVYVSQARSAPIIRCKRRNYPNEFGKFDEVIFVSHRSTSTLWGLRFSHRWLWRVLSYGIKRSVVSGKLNWRFGGTYLFSLPACYLLQADLLPGLLFEPDDGGDMFPRNIC